LQRSASIALLLLAAGAVAQTPKAAPKQPSSTAKKSPAAPKRSAASKAAAGKSAAASKSARNKRVVARSRVQRQPAPERYTEIQQALVDKGYFSGKADGVWGPDSVAALKRFQEDQKLEATGKIDALSLIRLGLGPTRGVAQQNGGLPPSAPKVER
jgi:peptidoglycan hydrolase-like protein with peptidoglycan-binding domain